MTAVIIKRTFFAVVVLLVTYKSGMLLLVSTVFCTWYRLGWPRGG